MLIMAQKDLAAEAEVSMGVVHLEQEQTQTVEVAEVLDILPTPC